MSCAFIFHRRLAFLNILSYRSMACSQQDFPNFLGIMFSHCVGRLLFCLQSLRCRQAAARQVPNLAWLSGYSPFLDHAPRCVQCQLAYEKAGLCFPPCDVRVSHTWCPQNLFCPSAKPKQVWRQLICVSWSHVPVQGVVDQSVDQ